MSTCKRNLLLLLLLPCRRSCCCLTWPPDDDRESSTRFVQLLWLIRDFGGDSFRDLQSKFPRRIFLVWKRLPHGTASGGTHICRAANSNPDFGSHDSLFLYLLMLFSFPAELAVVFFFFMHTHHRRDFLPFLNHTHLPILVVLGPTSSLHLCGLFPQRGTHFCSPNPPTNQPTVEPVNSGTTRRCRTSYENKGHNSCCWNFVFSP